MKENNNFNYLIKKNIRNDLKYNYSIYIKEYKKLFAISFLKQNSIINTNGYYFEVDSINNKPIIIFEEKFPDNTYSKEYYRKKYKELIKDSVIDIDNKRRLDYDGYLFFICKSNLGRGEKIDFVFDGYEKYREICK